MKKIINYLRYDNSVPMVALVLFLGAGGAFAATDPQSIINSTDHVVSVDNTYIVNKDLNSWTPKAKITGVTEDSENYYIAYNLETISLQDAVWRDVSVSKVLSVAKASIGTDVDLGLYATEQLKQVVSGEIVTLKSTQEIEKKQVSQKMVTTVYGGLIGKMLDSKTEVLPGYTPVIAPPVAAAPEYVAPTPIQNLASVITIQPVANAPVADSVSQATVQSSTNAGTTTTIVASTSSVASDTSASTASSTTSTSGSVADTSSASSTVLTTPVSQGESSTATTTTSSVDTATTTTTTATTTTPVQSDAQVPVTDNNISASSTSSSPTVTNTSSENVSSSATASTSSPAVDTASSSTGTATSSAQ